MLGVPFFDKAVALERRHGAERDTRNAIQSNGTLLDDGWGKFLAGVSLDEREDVHDA